MASFLDKVRDANGKMIDRGMYDPSKRYGFKNITDEPFTFTWDSNPITIKPGVEVTLPEHLALMATHKLVDQIILNESRAEEIKMRKEYHDQYWESSIGKSRGVPSFRKPYEDKILRELKLDEDSPEVQVMRAQVKEQVLNDLKKGQERPAPIEAAATSIVGDLTSSTEFPDIPKK